MYLKMCMLSSCWPRDLLGFEEMMQIQLENPLSPDGTREAKGGKKVFWIRSPERVLAQNFWETLLLVSLKCVCVCVCGLKYVTHYN